jgi:Acyl-CoA dehydrogenase, N-terminal domain
MPVPDLPTDLVPLTAEQQDVISLCRRFAVDVLRPNARAVDEEDNSRPGEDTAWSVWRRGNDAGIGYFMLPAEVGGGGVTDVFTQPRRNSPSVTSAWRTWSPATASSPIRCWRSARRSSSSGGSHRWPPPTPRRRPWR